MGLDDDVTHRVRILSAWRAKCERMAETTKNAEDANRRQQEHNRRTNESVSDRIVVAQHRAAIGSQRIKSKGR